MIDKKTHGNQMTSARTTSRRTDLHRILLASAVATGAFSWAGAAGAVWGAPLTAKASLFGSNCPSGGWAEVHDSTYLPVTPPIPNANILPVFCPRSYNDYTGNHMHGSMHATGFLHSDNGYYGIYDDSGNVYGSSDIAIRLDPTNFFANASEDQGWVDTWIYRNPTGMVVRNPHDVRHFVPNCPSTGQRYDDPLVVLNAFKTERNGPSRCPPPALRRAKEPAVATLYAGFFTTTYVVWLEREFAKYNSAPSTYEKSWKVFVSSVAHVGLNGQQQDPAPLLGGLSFGGALNQDPMKDAHSPKIAVVAGAPWVVWAEDRDTGFRDTHVKAWENGTWVTKGSATNTGEAKNCYGRTQLPLATAAGVNDGYSTDITPVGTTSFGEVPAIVSASEVSGECRLVVRMFYNNAWQLVGGGTYPGQASGLVGDAVAANNPRIIGTLAGDLYVVWQEGSTIRASTAHVTTGAGAQWKDLTGPYTGGHWGNGTFPSVAVTPNAANGTQYNNLSIASVKAATAATGNKPTVSVDRGRVGLVTNTEGFVQKTRDLVQGVSANVQTDGKDLAIAWESSSGPTNLIPATNGQVGVFDNYLIAIQREDNHRASDTGVFVRRGSGS